LAADTTARNNGCVFPKTGTPFNARVGNGFTRGYGAKLGEAIQQSDFLFVEIARWLPGVNFRRIFKTQ